MPIIPQILNINNLRTTSAKSINLQKNQKAYRKFSKKRSCKDSVHSDSFGDIAVRWQVGIITLPEGIDEKQPKVDYANFRPISLLSYFKKIIKKLPYKRISDCMFLSCHVRVLE